MAWLEKFYVKVARYLHVSEQFFRRVLPNQYGRFCAPTDLNLDKIGDEELKSISVSFRSERAECDLPERLLERRLQLPDWNMPPLGLEAPLELQEACTRLLGWIQEHPQKAERCFPAFCKEEQMRLLTPKAAVSLRRKADRLGELLALAGMEDPETLATLIQNGLRETAPAVAEDFLDFDPDSGLFFDEDWDGILGEDRRERLWRIGTAGERRAFRAVVNYLAEQGFAVESDDGVSAILWRGETRAAVHRSDTEEFHQPGWDIEVRLWNEQNGQEARSYYIEVKTHTPRSRTRSLLPLSDTQMRQAAGLGGQYVLLRVIYDEASDCAIALRSFRNVIEHLADGTLRGAEGRYVLKWANWDIAYLIDQKYNTIYSQNG